MSGLTPSRSLPTLERSDLARRDGAELAHILDSILDGEPAQPVAELEADDKSPTEARTEPAIVRLFGLLRPQD